MAFCWRGAVICACGLAIFAGCVSGPPKPKSLVRQSKKAYKNSDYSGTMRGFEKVLDTTPYVLNRSRYKDEIEMYHDAQIKYGLATAQKLETEGRLIDAWIYYVQLSVVDPDRRECQQAVNEAARLRLRIAEDFTRDAKTALANGRVHDAALAASQGLWYGGEEAEQILRDASQHGGIGTKRG